MAAMHRENDAAETLPQDPIEVVRILWQRKFLVALSLAGCICLGAVYWFVAPRICESQAQILVIRTSGAGGATSQSDPQGMGSCLRGYLSAHESLVKCQRIVSRAGA